MRPLITGAGVMIGMEVLLSEKTDDMAEDKAVEAVEDGDTANNELDDVVSFLIPTAICWRMAALDPERAIVELPEDFKKQLTAPDAVLE